MTDDDRLTPEDGTQPQGRRAMTGYYLKWTCTGRVPSHQGGEPIPYRKWTERVPNPVVCQSGWHGAVFGVSLDGAA